MIIFIKLFMHAEDKAASKYLEDILLIRAFFCKIYEVMEC